MTLPKKSSNEELEEKIRQLEKKLDWLEDEKKREEYAWMKPEKELVKIEKVGESKSDMIKNIEEARKQSQRRAGLVNNTASGSVHEEDNTKPVKIPSEPIHHFDNLKECTCTCHPHKRDCMNCYDHPEHLEGKRKKPVDEYDEVRIMQLIEEDRAKKQQKPWYKRVFSS